MTLTVCWKEWKSGSKIIKAITGSTINYLNTLLAVVKYNQLLLRLTEETLLNMQPNCINHNNNNSLPCSGSSGSPQDWGLPYFPGGFSGPVKIKLSVNTIKAPPLPKKKSSNVNVFSAVTCSRCHTALLFICTLLHAVKSGTDGQISERDMLCCLTLLQCKLRTSLTALLPLLCPVVVLLWW